MKNRPSFGLLGEDKKLFQKQVKCRKIAVIKKTKNGLYV